MNCRGTRDQLRAELTRWLEYRRSNYWSLKNACAHVTSGELRDALDAYEDALETVSRFVHELEDEPREAGLLAPPQARFAERSRQAQRHGRADSLISAKQADWV